MNGIFKDTMANMKWTEIQDFVDKMEVGIWMNKNI